MKVRELMRHLLELDPENEVRCINRNDQRNEFDDSLETSVGDDITSVVELSDGTAIYYVGARIGADDEDDLDE